MTWLTLRQFRLSAISVAALLTVVAAVLVVVGRPIASPEPPGLTPDYSTYYYMAIIALYLLPAIIGAFWGAPMISREVENGTHRLVWNQSVTRTRWLLNKMGIGALAAVVAMGLLSVLVMWWSSPIDTIATENGPAGLPIAPMVFGARGVVPLAYAVFAFALGITASALLRRTVPAIAVTLVVFTAFQVMTLNLVRPNLIPPVRETHHFASGTSLFHYAGSESPYQLRVPDPTHSWVLEQQTVDRAGNPVQFPAWFGGCVFPDVSTDNLGARRTPETAEESVKRRDECFDRLNAEGYQQLVSHHPNSRFWALQGAESAFYLVLAALLAWFALHWTRRRIS
ncbi:ABC-type transport system involved in multi-copper enzyme maturation permease subunit [Saccharothrix coeruleofusca]|uniref:ABC transporter permease n=1 Tax=Saccharothrix coeruleofusca TaxID=33919 RepID=UPI001AE528BC|nr:ABC transporter permease subunit [Saccharothrix coeruleofusca]MBP2335609.1 ABC-type transport system involved in multi-copper enzyme maturation permease subunit [Saccharothrix coeruleofusca]